MPQDEGPRATSRSYLSGRPSCSNRYWTPHDKEAKLSKQIKSSAGQNTFSRPSRNPIYFWFNVPVVKSLARISSLLDLCFDAKSRTSSELPPPLIIISREVHCRLPLVVGKRLYSLRVLQTQPVEECISSIRDVICKTTRSSVWTASIESIKCKCFGGSSWIYSVFMEKWKEKLESVLLWWEFPPTNIWHMRPKKICKEWKESQLIFFHCHLENPAHVTLCYHSTATQLSDSDLIQNKKKNILLTVLVDNT